MTTTRRMIALAAIAGIAVGAPTGYIAGRTSPPPAPPTTMASDHGSHGAGMVRMPIGETAAAKGFREAGERMHRDMATASTGDVDLDFAQGMLPHHQGAVDMAKVEIEHGSDPQMLALARTVVRTQEAEIADMRRWIAKHGGATAGSGHGSHGQAGR